MSAKAYSYIRWSSKAQTEGDSLRRQLKSSRSWAEKRGIELDESLRDEGVSSFTGRNRKKGDLGKFIAQVDNGEVKAGSYLLIDEFSRLGREPEVQMLNTFTSLVLKGITIVTMNDEKEYGGAISQERLMGALMAISVSHQQVLRMGKAVAEAHAESKRQAREEGRVWHKSGPSWLRFNDGTRKFDTIPEKVAVVQRIFDMIERGMGTTAVAAQFNVEKLPPLKHGGNWQSSAVRVIARSRTVLGEYQPKFAKSGDRSNERPADGEPIPGYYGEPVVPLDQFHRVQAVMDGRNHHKGRRNSPKEFNNLFQGICRCGECAGTVGFHVAGKSKYVRSSALRCNNAPRKASNPAFPGRPACTHMTRFNYPKFEAAFLASVTDFEIPTTAPVRNQAEQELDAALAKQAELGRVIANLADMVEQGSSTLVDRLIQRERELHDLNTKISGLRSKVNQSAHAKPVAKHQQELAELIARLSGDGEVYALRASIAQAIKNVVDFIEFDPDGDIRVILYGGAKAYLFRDNKVVGAVDLRETHPPEAFAYGKKSDAPPAGEYHVFDIDSLPLK